MKKQLKILALISTVMLGIGGVQAASNLTDVYDDVVVTTPLTLVTGHGYRVAAGEGNTMASVIMDNGVVCSYGAAGGALTGGSVIQNLTVHGGGTLSILGGGAGFVISNLVKDGPGKLVIELKQAFALTLRYPPTLSNGASYSDFVFRLNTSGGTLALPPEMPGDITLESVEGSISSLYGMTFMPILKGKGKVTIPDTITAFTRDKIKGFTGILVTRDIVTID